MNIPNCPSCGNHDSARRVSAIVKEQSGSGEATTTGKASKPLHLSYQIKAQTNSTHQSDLAGQLIKKNSTSLAGSRAIGVGAGLLLLALFGSFSSTTLGNQNGTLIVGVGGLVALIYGIAAGRRDRSAYAARKSEADNQNMRIENGWYCAKCDVRFDESGAF